MASLPAFLPFLLVLCLALPSALFAMSYAPPPVMLAKSLVDPVFYQHYSVSEKLDGVRAFWNGRHLLTRSGRIIGAPEWFLNGLPEEVLDGELWLGRGRFDQVSGLIRSSRVEDEQWRRVKYMVFDLPNSVETFEKRNAQLEQLVRDQDVQWLRAVQRYSFQSKSEVDEFFAKVVAKGGEGLMLNQKQALYKSYRTDAILKLKPSDDDEARVVGYHQGSGKYEGLMGSLVVEWQGREFKLGTGFSMNERKQPPPIGSLVTFQYSGFTSTGLPRFARFLRQFQGDL